MTFEYAEIIALLEHNQIVTYLHFAGVTTLVYDYLLTLSLEISLVWPTPWTMTKVLFLVTRYLPFIDASFTLYHQLLPNATTSTCETTYRLTGWMFVIGIAVAEVILTIRTWAIWGRDKRLAIGLPIFFAACFVPLYTVLGIYLNSMKFDPMPSPRLLGCLVTGGSEILFLVWILLMIYEAGIFFLMLIKGIRTYKYAGNSGLYRVIFRDGLLYYTCLFALSIANVVVVLALPRDFTNLLASVERAIHAILTCRVLLGLKVQVSKDVVVLNSIRRPAAQPMTYPTTIPRIIINNGPSTQISDNGYI